MTDYGTIKIPRDEYERHNQRRQDLGLSWADYIDGEAPEVRNGGEVDAEALGKAVADELDAVRDPASMAADPAVDGEAVAEKIANRLDDLEARLPRKVAEEVHRQR